MKTTIIEEKDHVNIQNMVSALRFFEKIEVREPMAQFGIESEITVLEILRIPGGYLYTQFFEDVTTVFVPS